MRIHKSEHKAVLKALLSKNDDTDFNTTDPLGWTPMHKVIKLKLFKHKHSKKTY